MIITVVKAQGVCYESAQGGLIMDHKGNNTLGMYLQREREAREVSRESLAKAAKIALPLLTALEEGNYDAFPERKAIPDYLKRYCRYLLIDAEEALRIFARQPMKQPPPPAAAPPPENGAAEVLPEITKGEPVPPPKPVAPTPDPPKKDPRQGDDAGFFHRHRPVLKSLAALSIFLVMLGVVTFNYHPLLQDRVPPAPPDKPALPVITKIEVPPPPAPPTSPTSPDPSSVVKKNRVVADRDNKLYYLPGMKDYQQIKEIHRVEFPSEEAAVRAGYRKAGR